MTSPILFDRPLQRLRQTRLRPEALFLLERAAADLAERLSVTLRDFTAIADIGTPGEAARDVLRRHAPGALVTSVGLDRDDEGLALAPQGHDLIVSLLALHNVNDLPGALIQIRRALKPDGLFLAALIGGETLTELRQSFTQAEAETTGGVSPRVHPFADLRDMGGLLQRAGFALPVSDLDRVVVRYRDVFGLMADLRAMGATNALVERRRTGLRRDTLARLAEVYAGRFSDADGRLRATFDILWVSGWAPHESQQKPLKAGSAQARLADALGVKEQSTGEKTGK
jgi:SAM-dependent methyltransferase